MTVSKFELNFLLPFSSIAVEKNLRTLIVIDIGSPYVDYQYLSFLAHQCRKVVTICIYMNKRNFPF